MYYNRKTKKFEDDVDYKSNSLNFLYKTMPGRFVLWSVAARPWFSNLASKYQKSKLSKKDIVPFIEKYHVFESKEYAKKAYGSFNDFFTRKKMICCEEIDGRILVSPADSKMQFFPITDDLVLNIKNSKYQIADILKDRLAAESFKGGTCIVFRLSVDDYHRYHFIDDGKAIGEVPLDHYVGYASVFHHDGDVTKADASAILSFAKTLGSDCAERILIGGKATVTEEAASVFADAGVKLVGNESQTVGPENAPKNVHMILLGAGVTLLEGIRLPEVPNGKYLLNCAPLNLGGADGAPCRAILISEEE